MPWWGWIVVGATLLGSELLLVDAGFYLVFLGVSALIVGLADAGGFGGEPWQEWAGFAAVSLVTMVGFRRRIYSVLRGAGAGADSVQQGVTGEHARVIEAIAPGEEGRAELHGSQWTARNSSDETLEAGERVLVERAEGVTLYLRNPQ